MGSIPVEGSDVFFVPRSCQVDQFTFHKRTAACCGKMLRYLNYHGNSLFSPVPKRYTNQRHMILMLVLIIYSQLESFPEVSGRLPVTLNLNDVLNHVLLLINACKQKYV